MKIKWFVKEIIFFEPFGSLIILYAGFLLSFGNSKWSLLGVMVLLIILLIREELIFRKVKLWK